MARVTRRTTSRRPRMGRAARWALAATTASTVFAASYALQRLASWYGGEVSWTDVIAQEHTPFYWRCAVAALHGTIAGLVVGLGVDEHRSTVLLRWAPLVVPLVVLPLALAMVAVP